MQMSKEYSQEIIDKYVHRLDERWKQDHRLRAMWYREVINPFVNMIEVDLSVSGLIDKHFVVVEGNDFTRREEKLLANLLKRVE